MSLSEFIDLARKDVKDFDWLNDPIIDLITLGSLKSTIMKEQNFKNHARTVPGFHGALFLLIVLFGGGAISHFIRSSSDNFYLASLLLILFPIFVLFMWFTRTFALKAQDRAIRAEEKLRYFLMTQKPIPEDLKLSQIIALRFASDKEYLELLERARSEKLSAKEIKAQIKNWKADYHRV